MGEQEILQMIPHNHCISCISFCGVSCSPIVFIFSSFSNLNTFYFTASKSFSSPFNSSFSPGNIILYCQPPCICHFDESDSKVLSDGSSEPNFKLLPIAPESLPVISLNSLQIKIFISEIIWYQILHSCLLFHSNAFFSQIFTLHKSNVRQCFQIKMASQTFKTIIKNLIQIKKIAIATENWIRSPSNHISGIPRAFGAWPGPVDIPRRVTWLEKIRIHSVKSTI